LRSNDQPSKTVLVVVRTHADLPFDLVEGSVAMKVTWQTLPKRFQCPVPAQ
jgi:hypothetical protein